MAVHCGDARLKRCAEQSFAYGGQCMIEFFMVSGIIMAVLLVFTKITGDWDRKVRAKRMEPINQLNREYERKLKKWCDENNVIFKENVTKLGEETGETWVNQVPGYIWFSDKNIVFCPDALNCNSLDVEGHVLFIKYEDIKYYTKDGSIRYTTEIVDNGKDISVSGAVIGGILAGEAGAIIGSRKDANKPKSVAVRHDEVHTYIYVDKGNEVKLVDVKGNEFYQLIMHQIPEKEYNYLLNQTNIQR